MAQGSVSPQSVSSLEAWPQDGFVEALRAAVVACRTLPALTDIATARGEAEAVFDACLRAAKLAGTLHPATRRLVDAANLARGWRLEARRALAATPTGLTATTEQSLRANHQHLVARLAELADEIEGCEPHL